MDTRPVSPGIPQPLTQPSNTAGPAESQKTSRARNVKENRDATPMRGAGERKDWDVQISPEAQDLAEARRKAMAVAKQTSPIREDRVADLKRRIADGSYKVDAGKIADGMMTEAVKDHVALNPEEYWENE